jgi:glycosyltransferase involved in cell wall biosynthesis
MSAAPRPRRLLLVSFSFAPMLHARAFRWTALAKHFAAHGWEVDVLTSWQPGAVETAEGGLRVHRTGWRWAERLRNVLQRERGQTAAAAASAPAAARAPGIGSRLLHALRDGVWKPFYWPDSSCFWYWPARKAAMRLMRERAHDVVVSVTPTFTGVLVGEALHRAYPRARWVLDVGDPFSLQVHAAFNNLRLYGSLNRRVERRAFAAADAVSVTTPQTAARYADAFPESAGKVRVIPPLLSAPEGPSAPLPGDAVRFVYVGTLYKELREPGFLLEAFDALRKRLPLARLELHFYGDAHQFAGLLETWRGRLGAALQVHGSVPRAMVAAAIEGAAVLVNIGNRSEDQLPSKVVEYVASGKPVLNIGSAAGDLSAEFLRAYPDKLLLRDSGAPSPEQVAALERFCAALPRRVPEREVKALLEPYTLPRIAAAYEAIFA